MPPKKDANEPEESLLAMAAVASEMESWGIVSSLINDTIYKNAEEKLLDIILKPKVKPYAAVMAVYATSMQLKVRIFIANPFIRCTLLIMKSQKM